MTPSGWSISSKAKSYGSSRGYTTQEASKLLCCIFANCRRIGDRNRLDCAGDQRGRLTQPTLRRLIVEPAMPEHDAAQTGRVEW
jgi:hypothetical protein